MLSKFSITGIGALQKELSNLNNFAKHVPNIVKKNGADLERTMKRNASFTRGYQTGETKRSIRLTIKGGGYTADVKPSTEHAFYLENGTRFMGAQPFVKPSLDSVKPKFISELQRMKGGL